MMALIQIPFNLLLHKILGGNWRSRVAAVENKKIQGTAKINLWLKKKKRRSGGETILTSWTEIKPQHTITLFVLFG